MLNSSQIKKIQKEMTISEAKYPVIFHALSDPTRFKIFKIVIKKCDVCVGDIARICKISPSAASQHLKILEMSGLIKRERMGQSICYEIKDSDPVVRNIIKLIS